MVLCQLITITPRKKKMKLITYGKPHSKDLGWLRSQDTDDALDSPRNKLNNKLQHETNKPHKGKPGKPQLEVVRNKVFASLVHNKHGNVDADEQ